MLKQWIKSMVSPPAVIDDENANVAFLLHSITLWGMPILLIFGIVRILSGESLFSVTHTFIGVVILAFLAGRIAIHFGYVRGTGRTLIFLAWAGVTYLAWNSDGLQNDSLAPYLTLILASGLLLGELDTLILFFISIAAIWGFAYADFAGSRITESPQDSFVLARDLTFNYFLLTIFVYYMIRTLRRSFNWGRLEIKEHERNEIILKQQAAYLSALHETTLGIINRLELRPLLESILTQACELVDTEHGLIELVVPDNSAMRLELGLGIRSPQTGRLTYKNQGLTGRVWASGNTQIVNNYSEWEYRDPNVPNGFNAIIGLPLKNGDKVIGVLGLIQVGRGKEFTAQQVSLLERFSSLASLAIDNARLYEAARRELTERRLIQSALHENEEKFRKVFHSSPVAICITAFEDGRLLEANYAYWNLMGIDLDDSLGKTSEELKLWNTPEERDRFVKDLKVKGSIYNPDDSFEDESGKLKQVISFYELIHIGGNECVLSMFYDMSEQRLTMDALKGSEMRTRALLEAIPDMILEITREGMITNMIPPKGIEASGPASQFIGRQVRDVFSESAAEQTFFAVERSIAGDQTSVFEFEEDMGGTARTMEARIIANTSQTILMMVRDITQRKWIEYEREQLINQLEARNKESETLRDSLASIVGATEFSAIIQRVLDQIQLVVPYDSASVWRVEGTIQKFVVGRNLPEDFENTKMEFETNETNSALPILNGEVPYILNGNVQEELPDFQEPPHSYVKSWLAVPLKTKGNIIGLIALDGKKKDQFNEHHSELAVIFANQVAIALENADLFDNLRQELENRRELIDELEEKNAEAETLRISTAIVAATLEISETVQRILEQLGRVVQYDSASVWLYDDESAFLVGSNGLPPGAELPGYYVLNDDEPDYKFWKDRVPYILLDDIQDQYPMFREPPIDYIHGWLAVAMWARGKLTGFISLDSRQPGRFTEHDADVALAFASQVSIALENARLFSDLQSELDGRRKLIEELELKNAEAETLQESTAIVAATLEKNEAIERILEQLKRVVPYDSASVQLIINDSLEIVGGAGLPLGVDELGTTFKIDDNEPAYPVLTDELPYIMYDNVQQDVPSFNDVPHDGIHSWLAVPLRVKEKIIGVIALDGKMATQFTERHAHLAVTYANQVAIALENARLFSDLQAELSFRQDLISELESKNAELERFTYTVSHDLKSPLFTIRGFLGYLEEDVVSGNHERMRSDMQRIKDATDKMQQLLNELLELSRVGRMKNESESLPFDELAREAVELVHGRIMERGVAVHIDAGMPIVYGDRPRLLEVLQNLVDNAAKFMGNQTEPRIEIGRNGEEDGMPIFHVRDNGMGIPLEHHERVFGLFNKLDVKSDGTGIGLALVKRIVEVHGGRIWVKSEAGKGATFYFTLPSNIQPDSVI